MSSQTSGRAAASGLPVWTYEQYAELLVAFDFPPHDYGRVSLLMGFDPESGEWIPEHRELDRFYPYFRWCAADEVRSIPALEPWLSHFPDLLELDHEDETELYRQLWRTALADVDVRALAYAFRGLHDIAGHDELIEQRRSLKRRFARRLDHERPDHRAGWTCSFPANGPPARILESRFGLDHDLKNGLGLLGVEPGLLLNYLRSRKESIYDLLDPRQFEEFVATLLRENGWQVELTQQTHDGGKDVVAWRDGDSRPETIYVEAKRHRHDNPVSISQIKEFTATLGGDNLERGFLVTTSHISPEARTWADQKGCKIAHVEPLSRHDLFARINALAGENAVLAEMNGPTVGGLDQ